MANAKVQRDAQTIEETTVPEITSKVTVDMGNGRYIPPKALLKGVIDQQHGKKSQGLNQAQ